MKSFSNLFMKSLAISLLSFSGGLTTQADGQDEQIEIVDQDGQKVAARSFKFVARQQDETGKVAGKADVIAMDGKIVIIDKDGKEREIDVSGAQNIVVNKSVQTIMKNGGEQRRFTGKAVIIGPDGERQEIILGGDGGDVDLLMPDLSGLAVEGVFDLLPGKGKGRNFAPGNFVFGTRGNMGKYMIGVNCDGVSDQLRAHLDLAEGEGLVVTSVADEDSPAAIAGIKQHDILIGADQEDLNSIQDLVDAVQLAGKEDRELTITLLRGGKELGVDVKPAERKTAGIRVFNGLPANEFRFEKVGPGFVFEAESNAEVEADSDGAVDGDGDVDFDQWIERTQERFEEMRRLHRQQLDEIRGMKARMIRESAQRAKDNDKNN